MLKSIWSLMAIFLSAAILGGCNVSINDTNDRTHTLRGSGRIVSETRNVAECSGVEVQSAGEVYLIQEDRQSIRIEADDNVIDRVICRRENGTLVVGLPEGSYSNVTLKIYVSLKSIELLSIQGAGNIECRQPVNSDNLYCLINGAGNIKLEGNGTILSCILNGAGNIEAKEFTTKRSSAVVNGAGRCTLYATDELDAAVNGVGSIIYYGNPVTVNTSISGIGEVEQGK